VHAGEVDVLVGTQMVAKGHDFRRMTLVAAVNPDGALFSSDFRAPERLFALLMQAAGRAGRDAAQAARSEMWVQTWHPRTRCTPRCARTTSRPLPPAAGRAPQPAGLPPFAHLALLRADARRRPGPGLPARRGAPSRRGCPRPRRRDASTRRCRRRCQGGRRRAHADAGGVGLAPALQRCWRPGCRAARAARAHKGLQRWAVDVDPLAI
jgi:primosomal protein N' (replication factor Y) (superfamily II helicase)